MTKEQDYVIEIMNKWYSALKKNNTTVEPTAATLLGGILTEYNLTPKEKEPDVFDKYLNTPASEMNTFWNSLNDSEKAYIESKRMEMRKQYYHEKDLRDDQGKTLLKG